MHVLLRGKYAILAVICYPREACRCQQNVQVSGDSLNAHVHVPVPDPSGLTKTGAVGAPGQAAPKQHPKHRCRVPSKGLALFHRRHWPLEVMNDPSPTRPSPPWLPVSHPLFPPPDRTKRTQQGPLQQLLTKIANHKPAAATRLLPSPLLPHTRLLLYFYTASWYLLTNQATTSPLFPFPFANQGPRSRNHQTLLPTPISAIRPIRSLQPFVSITYRPSQGGETRRKRKTTIQPTTLHPSIY